MGNNRPFVECSCGWKCPRLSSSKSIPIKVIRQWANEHIDNHHYGLERVLVEPFKKVERSIDR